MDKQVYKELLADEMTKSSQHRKVISEIISIVSEEPNDMSLGARIRQYIFSLKEDKYEEKEA